MERDYDDLYPYDYHPDELDPEDDDPETDDPPILDEPVETCCWCGGTNLQEVAEDDPEVGYTGVTMCCRDCGRGAD